MKKLQFFNSRLSSGGTLVVALMATHLFNFLFSAILGRTLSLEQFSLLTLANTLWFLITIFLTSLASTTNNRTAYLSAKRGEDIAEGFRNFIVRKTGYISIVLSVAWILLIPLFSWIFHTRDYSIFLLLTPTISLGIFTAVNRGHFQGMLAFSRAAVVILVESISKLALSIAFIILNLKEYAYLAIPVSIMFAFFVSYFLVNKLGKGKRVSYSYVFPRRLLFATFLTVFSSAAFLSVDLLLARLFLSPRDSGAYSLLSLVGKMLYFFGGLFSVFILTFASRDTGLNKRSTKNFYKILTLNLGLLIIGFLGLGIFGKTFVPMLLGDKSIVVLEYLVPYTAAIALFSAGNSFATYHLAKQQFIFAYNGILAILIAILGMIFWHRDMRNFVDVIILSSYIYLAGNLLLHIFYKDISEYVDEEDVRKFGDFGKIKKSISVSICLPAYNEAKNIGRLIDKLLNQQSTLVNINKIIVVSSGSTDNTNKIVSRLAKNNKQIVLISEKERRGKANAINTFLKKVKDPVVVIQSADTFPMEDTIEKLCRPFLVDKAIGMTGGAPIPLNDPNTFLGYIIHAWWWFHRRIPRFGEIIAFRNIIKTIPDEILCDEAYFQAKFSRLGYKRVHVDEAKIYNMGPHSIREIIKQRRKLFIGHSLLYKTEGVRISNMTKSSIRLILLEYRMFSFKELVWLIGGIVIESYSHILGIYDTHVKKINPYVWDIAKTTKDLSRGRRGRSKKW